ncbi:MAG: hypothetical protein AAGH87_01935 [Pseudomonadota bacterium]
MSFRTTLLRTAMAAGVSLVLAGVAQAQSLTDAGTSVSNTFTLDYQVGATQQARITNDPDEVTNPSGGYSGPTPVQDGSPTLFTVDRLVDLTLTAVNSPTADVVQVAPGAEDQALVFTLTNTGNDNQAYSFNLADLAVGSTAEFEASDLVNLDIRFVRAAVDLNGDNDTDDTCEGAQDETVSSVALGTVESPGADLVCDLPPGGTATVTVIGDIPQVRTNNSELEEGDTDSIILVAETRNPTVWTEEGVVPTANQGDLTVADADGNDQVNDAENVFADGSSSLTGDAANDGRFGDSASWVIIDPELTAAKTVGVLAESSTVAACQGLAGTVTPDPNAYSVPGACVEYTITVTNNAESTDSDATGITIVDALDSNVIWVSTATDGFDASPAPTVTNFIGATSNSCTQSASEDCVVTVSGAALEATAGATTNVATVKIRALIE